MLSSRMAQFTTIVINGVTLNESQTRIVLQALGAYRGSLYDPETIAVIGAKEMHALDARLREVERIAFR